MVMSVLWILSMWINWMEGSGFTTDFSNHEEKKDHEGWRQHNGPFASLCVPPL